jgi:hypothetical protein
MTPVITYPYKGFLEFTFRVGAEVYGAFGAVPGTELMPFRSVA